MKLSEQTVAILKNFSAINQNLIIKQGSEISTVSAMKNIVASAKVEAGTRPVVQRAVKLTAGSADVIVEQVQIVGG